MAGSVTFTKVSIDGAGNRLSVAPGQEIEVAFAFTTELDSCASLPPLIVSARIGFAEGATACSEPTSCVSLTGATSTSRMLTAPSEPGEYGIYGALENGRLLDISLGFDSCGMPFDSAPDEGTRIATVCVE
jgi:hypothetical protein